MGLCEFEANLVYRASSRTVRAVTQKNPVSKNKRKNSNNKIIIRIPGKGDIANIRYLHLMYFFLMACLH